MTNINLLRNLFCATIALSLLATPALGYVSASYNTWTNYWNGHSWVTPTYGYYPYNYGSYGYSYPYNYNSYGRTYDYDYSYDYDYTVNTVVVNKPTTVVTPAAKPAPKPQPVKPYCGDGWCTGTETDSSCPADCADDPYCGDSICSNGETTTSCPHDCELTTTFYCGDGICRGTETKYSCPTDCGLPDYCGDGSCNGAETKQSCPVDCGLAPYCGDSHCDLDESRYNCPEDCGLAPYCGDGTCSGTETKYSCSLDCGNPQCSGPSGSEGDTACKGREQLVCIGGDWLFRRSVQCCADADCPLGYDCESNRCILYTTCGDGLCLEGENPRNCPKDCGGNTPQPCTDCETDYCGDGTCNNGETCSSCGRDCGACYVCGDGVCDLNHEDQYDCPADCGEPMRRDIELTSSDECHEIVRGEDGVFTLTIANEGNVPEQLAVTVSGQAASWADLSADTVIVQPGASQTYNLVLDVPANAMPGLYNLSVTVGNSYVMDTAIVRVDVKLPEDDDLVSGTTAGDDDDGDGGNATSGDDNSGATGGSFLGNLFAGKIFLPDWVLVLAVVIVLILVFLALSSRKTTVVRAVQLSPASTSGAGRLTPDGGYGRRLR